MAWGCCYHSWSIGHFWVARRCGVKLLRLFHRISVQASYRWHDQRLAPKFVIAAIPLGATSRFGCDEREGACWTKAEAGSGVQPQGC